MALNVACSSLPSHQQVEAQKKSCTVEAKDAQMATTFPHGDVLQGASSHKCSATGRVACGELRAMATTEEGGSQHPLSWPHIERCTLPSIFTSHSITHTTRHPPASTPCYNNGTASEATHVCDRNQDDRAKETVLLHAASSPSGKVSPSCPVRCLSLCDFISCLLSEHVKTI